MFRDGVSQKRNDRATLVAGVRLKLPSSLTADFPGPAAGHGGLQMPVISMVACQRNRVHHSSETEQKNEQEEFQDS
jgi:hypothetical protein